jgi:hypothetical protein
MKILDHIWSQVVLFLEMAYGLAVTTMFFFKLNTPQNKKMDISSVHFQISKTQISFIKHQRL